MDFSRFCLAHVFTYRSFTNSCPGACCSSVFMAMLIVLCLCRDFPEGVQGLAWKDTICHAKWNTGFTTLLNHQVTASSADSAMTLAHEIGHNLGSDHDEMIGWVGHHWWISDMFNHVFVGGK